MGAPPAAPTRLLMLTGSNLIHTKEFNLRIVHETIRLHGPISRAEVARHTELTGQTVSNLVRELVARGLVHEGERRHERRGAPSVALTLNPDGAWSMGLDLDRDHLTGVLVDLAGTVRQRIAVALDFPTPAEAVDLMVDVAERLLSAEGIDREVVSGIGVGIPGPMHKAPGDRDYHASPKAFPGWTDVPIAELLRERLGLPVILENNATAAAVGERWYGAGQHLGTFFYVYFGSGLGGGLVMQGRPYEGHTGNAGEIGYLPTVLAGGGAGARVADGEDPPHVGLHFNLPRLYAALREDGAGVRGLDDLAVLLDAGHPRLMRWIEDGADHLTGLVLAVEYLLDPEAIFFGGRLPHRVLEALMQRVATQLPARRIGGKVTAPPHLLATAGVDAAALGVATLPIYELFAPATQVLLKPRRTGAKPARKPATKPADARGMRRAAGG
jgi:predicted NBD/HSP70 family sugar kinase